MKFTKIALAAIAFVASATVSAESFEVATGSKTGTYSQMFREAVAMCPSTVKFIEKSTTGSPENFDLIYDNKVPMVFMQQDVLYHKLLVEKVSESELANIKTLVPLHTEEVHVITQSTSGIKIGGFGGFGGKVLQLNTVSDLSNQSVAVWGGSFATASIIKAKIGIPFNIIKVSNFKEAKQLLDEGKVAAILMVGGQPLMDIKSLSSNYKLLPFTPDQVTSKLSGFYKPANLQYSNLGQGGTGITSVATEAALMTKDYPDSEMRAPIVAFGQCIKTNMVKLRDKINNHRAWGQAVKNSGGTWKYTIPETHAKQK